MQKGWSDMERTSTTEPMVKVKVEFEASLSEDAPKMLNSIGSNAYQAWTGAYSGE